MQAVTEKKANYRIAELCRDAWHVSAAYGNLMISYSVATPDMRFMADTAKATIAYAQQYPGGMGMVILIAANEPPPDEQGRRAIHAGYVLMKPCVRAAVLIVEGEGFAAAAKRSAVTVLTMASTTPFTIKVAGTPLDGAQKISKLLGPSLAPGLTPELIADAVDKVRATLAR